jgi:hypothetical protein
MTFTPAQLAYAKQHREVIQDAVNNGDLHRLRLRVFRNASCIAEREHIAAAVLRMTDEEVARLRAHLLPQEDDGSDGYSCAHPPPEWMDGITRTLLGVPQRMTGAQA